MAKWKATNTLECHNDLCEAKNNCNNYHGPFPKGTVLLTGRVKRESCRIYSAKEGSYVRKAYKYR